MATVNIEMKENGEKSKAERKIKNINALLDDAISERNMQKIKKLLTPKGLALAQEDTSNILENSLKVSFDLKKASHQDGPHEKELGSLGDTVEDFACHLMTYSKNVNITAKKEDFSYCICNITRAAIKYEAKKFLAGPTTQDFLRKNWTKRYFKEESTSSFWILANIWILFEVFLFPVVFLLLFIYHRKKPKRYMKHFETPYFIFVRDMLSYLTLLVLHFVVCVQPTGLRLSVLEWVIMVFFVGRVLLEVDQYVMEGSIYIVDSWNQLDIASIVIYIVTFICRLVTWSNSSYISHNPLPVATSYLYGINAMLLTWRVFGQTMEVTKSTGTKQIALFNILNAVIVIFMQMLATMLGFSLVLTKIYVAEVSYDAKANVTSHGICSTSTHGMLCWWHFFEFLTWSIVGLGDSNLLTLENSFSNYTTKLLYLLFLVVAAVIIMNMLIALLSNKYQEIEDNAFQEWSYSKAYIITEYCVFHPIPVPFNIISLPIKLLTYYCRKKFCEEKWKKKEKLKLKENENMHKVLLKDFCDRLQTEYLAEHGNSFSQDSCKTNQQLRENKWLMGHIADEVFIKDAIKTSSNDWKCSDGIKVEGRQLISVKCEKCKTVKSFLYCVHGALHQYSLSKEWPGFEVLIQQSGEERYLGIGVASEDYRLVDFPGRYPNSVGYHIDSGATFDRDSRKDDLGRKCEESMSFAGDLIGCLVLFDKQVGGDLPVQFTRNGRVVGEARLEAELIGNIHPLISMAYSGIHVLFRRIKNVNIYSTRLKDVEKVIKELQHDAVESAKKQQEILKILKYLKNNVHEDNHTEATSEGQHSLKSYV